MRNLQTTISTIVRQGSQLIVRGEVLRSFCANSLNALANYASWQIAKLSDASRPWPSVMDGLKPSVRTAVCFATVKQTTRRHDIVCRHASA